MTERTLDLRETARFYDPGFWYGEASDMVCRAPFDPHSWRTLARCARRLGRVYEAREARRLARILYKVTP